MKIKRAVSLMLIAVFLTGTLTACGIKKLSLKNIPGGSAYAESTSGDEADQAENADVTAAAPEDGADGSGDSSYSGGSGSYGGSSDSGSSGGSSDSGSSGGSGTRVVYRKVNSGSSGGSSGSSVVEEDATVSTKATTAAPPEENPRAKAILNSAKLNPMPTNCPEVDELVNSILDSIITPGMSNYQKARAIENYMVQNIVYGAPKFSRSFEMPKYYSKHDRDLAVRAYATLSQKRGWCIDFASAFTVLARAVGFECFREEGGWEYAEGKYAYHAWNLIRINGKMYFFDCEKDYRLSNGKATRYLYFCLDNYPEFKGSYTYVTFSGFKCK